MHLFRTESFVFEKMPVYLLHGLRANKLSARSPRVDGQQHAALEPESQRSRAVLEINLDAIRLTGALQIGERLARLVYKQNNTNHIIN